MTDSGRENMKNSEPLCWICGDVATTREHRIKKADLVRAYGRGPYTGASGPVHISGGEATPIQGPRSAKVKYAPSLCSHCNSSGTQDYDIAYDNFISWALLNENTILSKRIVDFMDPYGKEFPDAQLNLFKYFVKSFGCRLVDADHPVPPDLVSLLPLKHFQTRLRITFCVNEDVLLLPKSARDSFIGKGDLTPWMSPDHTTEVVGFTWHEHVSWLRTCIWYNRPIEGPMGSKWIADTQYVYLGSVAPLKPEQRRTYLESLQDQEVDNPAHPPPALLS